MEHMKFLVYADDVSILGENMNTVKKHTKVPLVASREVGLEVHTEKTKYMVMTRRQNSGQSHNILIANKSFGNVTNFKYFGTTLRNQKSEIIHEEFKSRLNSENTCYRCVQSLLSSNFIFKNLKIKI